MLIINNLHQDYSYFFVENMPIPSITGNQQNDVNYHNSHWLNTT